MGFLLVVHVDVQPTGVNTCENRKSEGGGGGMILHETKYIFSYCFDNSCYIFLLVYIW